MNFSRIYTIRYLSSETGWNILIILEGVQETQGTLKEALYFFYRLRPPI
jgi:hypothetical protein